MGLNGVGFVRRYPEEQDRRSSTYEFKIWLRGDSHRSGLASDQFEWCSGVWFHQEDHDRVGQCLIKLDTDAFLQVGHFCDAHGHCAFMGHVAGRTGDGFYLFRDCAYRDRLAASM
jgi:hypothetical protein